MLQSQPAWQATCASAGSVDGSDNAAVRRFFETHFTPYQAVNADGSLEGTITGYYEPLIQGSRQRSATYRYPVYGVPDDLLVVDLSELFPDLKHMRLRGRLEGRRVVPYYPRADIEAGKAAVQGHELLWTDDAVELFFLQIQGSGRARLDTGETDPAVLCRPERASVPLGGAAAGGAGRADPGPGLDAGHQGVGRAQPRAARAVAESERVLRLLP